MIRCQRKYTGIQNVKSDCIFSRSTISSSNQLNLFICCFPISNMKNKHSDTNDRLKKLLELARKIESLTNPSKDSEDFD